MNQKKSKPASRKAAHKVATHKPAAHKEVAHKPAAHAAHKTAVHKTAAHKEAVHAEAAHKTAIHKESTHMEATHKESSHMDSGHKGGTAKKTQAVWWKSRWFIGVGATVATLAVGIAVATPVALTIKNLGEKAVADLGVSPDKSTVSSMDAGEFKASKDKKINIVALGDSETAGYNGVNYSSSIPLTDYAPGDTSNGTFSGSSGKDLISYADYAALILRGRNRLGSFVNLAKSGATSSDLLNVLTKRETQEILAKANLVTLTIGANDLLRGFVMLGIPYDVISTLLDGALTSSIAQSKKSLGFDISLSTQEQAALLGSLLSTLQTTLDNNPEAVFTVNKDIILTALKNAAGEILRAVSLIHDLAPNAQIVFNDYVYPFNRWVHDGKNITEYESDVYRDLGFSTSTLKGTYDYVLGKVVDTVTSNFKVARGFSLQKAQAVAIDEQVKAGLFTSTEDGQKYFQKNFADIHPTELGHVLLGQKFFNEIIAPALGEDAFPSAAVTNETTNFSGLVSRIKTRIDASEKNLLSDLFEFLVNNDGQKAENRFISGFFSTALKPFTVPTQPGQPASQMVPMLSFIGQTYKMLAGGVVNPNFFESDAIVAPLKTERSNWSSTIALLMESAVFAQTDEAKANYALFTTPGAFKPYTNFGYEATSEVKSVAGYYDSNVFSDTVTYEYFKDRFSYIAKWVITEASLTHVSSVYSSAAAKIASLSPAARSAIKAAIPAFATLDDTSAPVSPATVLPLVKALFESITSLDTPLSLPGLPAALTTQFNDIMSELKRALVYAQASAEAFPTLFKGKGVTRKLEWKDLRKTGTDLTYKPYLV